MDRQGAEDPPPLPSQHLSSGAQQSTLPAYCGMLGDFLQEGPLQTSGPLNTLPKLLSVDRTSDKRPQLFDDIEPDNRDNISDSGATTQPLADDELENRRYWYEAQQVETSPKICHVEKIWQKDKYVLRVLYVVETYLPDNWLPENARLQLRKQEEKQRRRNKEMQRKKRLNILRPRQSTRN
ncbi:hypothetical protein ACJ73_07844 [Blastomyces percursus]|uniref:Uncharacterized protein n=1 Tax=Blastomyces percursus TaxID=1658174 RepID=A0A1J9PWY9_9EURO|nr:hypothetical protein ACJ73_07844 [Blastomyces percursus]